MWGTATGQDTTGQDSTAWHGTARHASYFRNDGKSSHTASQPGHLHTPCPYRGWLWGCSSWDRLEEKQRTGMSVLPATS